MHKNKHKLNSFMSSESERDASTRKGKILIFVLVLMLASRPFQCLSTLVLAPALQCIARKNQTLWCVNWPVGHEAYTLLCFAS